MNDSYIAWFLQSPWRVSDTTIGLKSKSYRLEWLFFGTRRYVMKRMTTKNYAPSTESLAECLSLKLNGRTSSVSASQLDDIHQENHERHPSIRTRCSSLTTIVRNLSFIEENLSLANDRRVLDILERILNCCHAEMHNSYDYHSSIDVRYTETCSDCATMLNIDEISFDSMQGPEELQSSMPTNNVSGLVTAGASRYPEVLFDSFRMSFFEDLRIFPQKLCVKIRSLAPTSVNIGTCSIFLTTHSLLYQISHHTSNSIDVHHWYVIDWSTPSFIGLFVRWVWRMNCLSRPSRKILSLRIYRRSKCWTCLWIRADRISRC